jgi:ubiquinol-cytochrome c reductase cytochrome b subunit
MGYTLPWDANAFSSANIAEGMTSGMPLIGGTARNFLLGGTELSTLSLSRFFALHVFIIAGLILFVLVARFFIFRENENAQDETIAVWKSKQLTRNAIVIGVVFLALSLLALKSPAPFGPTANAPAGEYIPRPGPQFLWLFQLLKYVPGGLASFVGAGLPPVFFGGLIILPFLDASPFKKFIAQPSRKLGILLFATCFLLVATTTSVAIISDSRDAKTRDQLAKQKAEEAAWRSKPFEPLRVGTVNEKPKDTNTSNEPTRPQAYIKHCASCHGAQGQGKSVYPPLTDLASKPRRSHEDMIGLMDNPEAYDLKPPMKSFKDTLTEEEKRAIAVWILSLKK